MHKPSLSNMETTFSLSLSPFLPPSLLRYLCSLPPSLYSFHLLLLCRMAAAVEKDNSKSKGNQHKACPNGKPFFESALSLSFPLPLSLSLPIVSCLSNSLSLLHPLWSCECECVKECVRECACGKHSVAVTGLVRSLTHIYLLRTLSQAWPHTLSLSRSLSLSCSLELTHALSAGAIRCEFFCQQEYHRIVNIDSDSSV